jgi:PAS domain S-box-containing protein
VNASALRREESLFKLCPLPIALISYPDGEFLDVNGAFLRQLGMPAERIVGATTQQIAMTVEPGKREELVRRLSSGEKIEGWRVWMVDAKGRSRAIELYADLIAIDGRQVTLVAGLDVSQSFLDPLTGLPPSAARPAASPCSPRGSTARRFRRAHWAASWRRRSTAATSRSTSSRWCGSTTCRSGASRRSPAGATRRVASSRH